MKKFIALFLALVMVFALCACGEAQAPAAPAEPAAPPAPPEPSAEEKLLMEIRDLLKEKK